MKKYSGFARWGPAAGMLAVGMLAFSLSLEGAAPSPQPSTMREKDAGLAPASAEATDATRQVAPKSSSPTRSGHATIATGPTSTSTEGIKFGRMPEGDFPIMAPVTVDYRDDTGSRLRQAGKLVGPYRPERTEGGVAGGCSFDIQCDDCNDCTNDVCNIAVGAAPNSGVCVNAALPNGAEGGCSDGLCCNGRETCQGGVCEAPGAGTGIFDQGACEFPPAGSSCVNGPRAGLGCADDADCRLCSGGTNTGNACRVCSGGSNSGDPCLVGADCPGGTCPGADNCPGGTCPATTCTGPALVCNEDSNISRLPCNGTSTCAITGGACTSTPDCPPLEDNYCMNCSDGVNCNGQETCVAGICEASTNPCGPGAICGERDCSGAGTTVCTTTSDCAALNLGTCTRPGPICFPGRCCVNSTAEPVCSKRKRAGGTCSGGSNAGGQCETAAQCRVCTSPASLLGKPCTGAADCPGGACGSAGTCPLTASCDANGGVWYATDDGDLPFTGGFVCPTDEQQSPPNDRTLCPKYSSGIAPLVNFDTETAFNVAFFSQGPCDHDEIGDDYEIENGDAINMEIFRWVGGANANSATIAARILIEFYDENGNFIEDIVSGGIGGGTAVHSLNILPPLTIPSKGYWVMSVATNFSPNAQGFVTATDARDEGLNLVSGSKSLWFDGGPIGTCLGGPTPGATCASNATCGAGGVCNNPGLSLRECVGGSNDGAWCDPSDPGDSECTAAPGPDGACQIRNNILAFEIEGEKPLGGLPPSGACCNNASGTCTNAVLPWICTGQGNNYQGNDSTCPGTCGVGACCQAGVCSQQTAAACPGPDTPPNFLGFGTDCDPNCCLQPTVTGSNNCAGAVVQNFIVPNPGSPAIVRTLSGNNAGATGPDTCLQGAWNAAGGTYLTVDPGWWEAFSINECAFVRIDFCCSEPVIEPQWAFIWEGCPCDDAVFTAVNPNFPEEAANKRGGPYCDEDNLWNNYGPLKGGTCTGGPAAGAGCVVTADCPGGTCTPGHTYYVPVYSQPQGAHGPYQMHITVKACPTAACCDGSSCVIADQLGCAAIDGANFLAPPFRTTATTNCTASTCSTGSCCYTPGLALCEDIVNGGLAQESGTFGCANGATYKGGARCKGCVCAAGSPPKSCNADTDCGAEGPCNCDGPQSQLQPSPCPLCDFQSIANCQLPFLGTSGWVLSDECVGDCLSTPPETEYATDFARAADDFVASVGGNITSVCITGQYIDQLGGGADCYADGPPEKFTVTIYSDLGGVPGPVPVGVRTTTVTRKTVASVSGGDNNVQYQLALTSPIAISQGLTYWIGVTNNTDESSGLPGCDWGWKIADPLGAPDKGNDLYMQDFGNVFSFDDAGFGTDLAWCINIANTVPTVGEAACCTCGGGIGSCSILTLEDCTNADGQWRSTEPDCIGVTCPGSAAANDNCASKLVVGNDSDSPWTNYCTNTDGPASAGNTGCTAGLDYQNDLWYAWTADCDGPVAIETCDLGGELDTGLLIYSNGNGTCPCPTSAANEVNCDDDGCVFQGAGSRITLNAVQGVCYTIRVTAFLGEKGSGVLHVGNCNAAPIVTPTADPSFYTFPPGGTQFPLIKTRFISFSVTGGTGETALRIKLTSLHHVVPPYNVGPSTPFTAFEGRSLWVGPPSTYQESSSQPLNTFKAAYAQCTPHYRDWNTVGLIHVTGAGIAPSSIYHVENVSSACQGIEGSGACLSGGNNVSAQLEIKTTRWGDIAESFNPPAITGQPDIADVTNMVSKFRSLVGAPIKARALIAGQDAFGIINVPTVTNDFNFGHIAACVDAFRGGGYPYKPGKCTGNPLPTSSCTGAGVPNACCTGVGTGSCNAALTGACTANSDCTGANANGTSPCILDSVGTCTGAPAAGFTGACRWSSQCTGPAANGAGPCVVSTCAP